MHTQKQKLGPVNFIKGGGCYFRGPFSTWLLEISRKPKEPEEPKETQGNPRKPKERKETQEHKEHKKPKECKET